MSKLYIFVTESIKFIYFIYHSHEAVLRFKTLPYQLYVDIFRGGISALAEPQNIDFTGAPVTTVKNVIGDDVKKGLPAVTQDGKVIKLSGNIKSPFTLGKDALKGAVKVPARANSADADDGSADTGEYTFGFAEKEQNRSYRDTYILLQDLTCTYPEDVYTNVQYSYRTSSENIYLVQDANNVLGNGEGRIYIYNSNSGREAGTIIITAELLNGEEVVASDSYTVNIIIDFGFSEVSTTATLGKPFTAPTLTNIYGTSVTYSVGNTQIATVDEKTGEVMPVDQGYTTVFATLDADNSVTASYSLAVNYPSVSLPYNESFAEGRGEFNITNKNLGDGLTDVWAHDGGNQCMTATGKADSGNKASESWLVSPSFHIGYYNGIDKTHLTFEQAVNNGFGDIAGEATLWVRELGGEWQNVAIAYPEAPADGSLSGFETQTVDLTAYLDAGSEKWIQFAFKYISSADAAGTWSIKNISVETKEKTFAFSSEEVTAFMGDEFTAPTLINDYGGTVVYFSGNEGVATVDENGVVTIVGPGQTSIYAILEEAGREAYYVLTVVDLSLPYEESFSGGKALFSIDDVALGEGLSEVWTHDSGNQCMKASATVDGAGRAAESWLVSPVIGELQDAEQKHTISFEQAVDNRFGDIDGETTLWVREEGGEWEPLAITHPTAPDDGTLSEFEVQTVNVLKYVGKKIQIGFRYTSSADAAGTWCIRNVSVNGEQRTFEFSATEAAATIGEEFTPPTLINEYEGYEVRYRSRATGVAKVDETTGEVTLVNRGATYIYAGLYDGDNQIREVSYRITVSGYPVVTLPYVETFYANIGQFTRESVKLAGNVSGVWAYNRYDHVMRAAPYASDSKKDVVMEQWLISPVINAETDESTLYLSFDHAINKDFGDIDNEATLWVREAGGEWSQLVISYPRVEAGFKRQAVNLSAYIGKKIQIGFKYLGSAESGGIWDIKNVQVSSNPTADLPYVESFAAGKGLFVVDNVTLGDGLSDVWTYEENLSCMKATSNADGVGKAAESWLISPVINAETDSELLILSFAQGININFADVEAEATLWAREENGEWGQLPIEYPQAGDGFRKQMVDLSEYIGKRMQIAFRYTGSEESAGTWGIKDVLVMGANPEELEIFAFTAEEVKATVGKEFDAPKLINTLDGTVTYFSEDEDVATVDEKTGEVTLVGPGETAIIAELEGVEPQGAYYMLTVTDPSSVALPYGESFEWDNGRFTIDNVTLGDGLTDVWTHDDDNQSMKATATVDGVSVASESWLVSPVITKSSHYNSLSLTFDQAIDGGFGSVETEATLWAREENGEWEQVAIAYPSASSADAAEFESLKVDLSKYAGERMQIAFRYTSSALAAGTWRIRNVSVEAFNESKKFTFSKYEAMVIFGEGTLTPPTLINDFEGTVTYFSSNTDVATVDSNTGEVTLVGPGETRIQATLDGETYRSTSYTLTVIDPASVGLPYEESFAGDMGRFTIDNVTLGDGLTDVWTHDGENQCMKATAKADGVSMASESWLVSPVINKSSYNNSLSFSFDQTVDNGFGDVGTEATLWVRDVDGDDEWEQVAIVYPSETSEFESQTIDISKYAGRRIQIAFKYTSSAEAAGTWSIRNVSVKGYNRIFAFVKSEVEVTMGDVVTHPALVNEYEGGTISYSSSDTDVATIDEETGVVRLVGPGQTSIIATLHGDGDIWNSASYVLTVNDPSMVGLPYEESFAWSVGRFTVDNVTLGDGLTDVWTYDGGNMNMKATATVDGVAKASESWLVSPVISKVYGDKKITLTFEQAVDNGFGDIDAEATLWAREDGGEWEQMAIVHPAAPADGGFSGFEGQKVNLSAYVGKSFQIAFRYTSSEDAAGTWRVRNIKVEKDPKKFAFSEQSVKTAIGREFTAPTLVNDYAEGFETYYSNNNDVAMVDYKTGEVTLVGPGTTEIGAKLQMGDIYRSASYTITVTGEPLAYYKKVTSADELMAGCTYVILNEAGRRAMALVGSGNSASVVGVATVNASSETYRVSGFAGIVIEQQTDGGYALRNRNGYVGCNAEDGFATEAGDASEVGLQWTIGFTAQGDAEIRNVASADRYIRFDATESVFRPYTSGEGAAVQLYKKVLDANGSGTYVNFRAVGNDGMFYATFSCPDGNVVFPDDVVEVKTVTVSDSKMTLKDVEKSWYVKDGDYSILSHGSYVPKGSGVLLRSTQETVPYYSVSEENSGMALDADNMLRGVDGDGVFEGEEGYRYYKLAYDDYDKKTDLGFYYGAPDGGPFEMRMGLAYLAVPESALSQTSEAAPAHFVFGGDGDVTTIRDIEAEGNAKEPVIYNMAGQRVEAIGQPGIYFVNGKKVVVK